MDFFVRECVKDDRDVIMEQSVGVYSGHASDFFLLAIIAIFATTVLFSRSWSVCGQKS